MSGSGQEALSDVREWSGGPRRCSGVIGRPPGCSGVIGWPSRMSGSVRKALPDSGSGREALTMSGSGRKALPDVREWSGGSLGCPRVVGRPFRLSGSGRKTLPDVRVWSRGPPRCSGVVGRQAFPDVQELSVGLLRTSRAQPRGLEWSEHPLGCSLWVGGPSRSPEVVGWLSWMCGGPPGCLRVVGRPCRMSGSG